MRRGSERGGAPLAAVARASSAPDRAWVRVSSSGFPQPADRVVQAGEIAHVDAAVRGYDVDEVVGLARLVRLVHERDAVLVAEADRRQPRHQLVLAGRRERELLVELDEDARPSRTLALLEDERADVRRRMVAIPPRNLDAQELRVRGDRVFQARP